MLQIFRSVVDDPVAGCARSAPAPSPPRPGEADVSIGADPELQRPPPNLPTTIPLKRTVDVGQQPQRRRAGRCRSVGVRARWNRRPFARAREGSESGKRCQIPLIFPSRSGRSAERARESAPLTVLQIFRSVVDDPVAGCARSAPAPSPPRPGEADVSIGADRRAPASAAESANNNSAKKNCRRRPAAAAPPSRPVQVGRRQSALELAALRARA